MQTYRKISLVSFHVGIVLLFILTGCSPPPHSSTPISVPDDRTPPDPPLLNADETASKLRLTELRQSTRIHPKDPNLYYEIGVHELVLRNLVEARKQFQKSLDLASEIGSMSSFSKAYYYIGITWEWGGEMYLVSKGRKVVMPAQREMAIAAYQKAVKTDPNLADAYYRLAVLALMDNNLDLASEASYGLTRIEPDSERTLEVMKEVYNRHREEKRR